MTNSETRLAKANGRNSWLAPRVGACAIAALAIVVPTVMTTVTPASANASGAAHQPLNRHPASNAAEAANIEILSNPDRIVPHPTTPKIWDRDQWVDRDAYAFGDLKWEGPAIPLPPDPEMRGQVLFIGDSITQHSAELIKSKGEAAGINGRVDAVGSRYIYDGIAALNRAIAPGSTTGVPQTVVVALGTNGKSVPAWTREAVIDNMLQALGPDRTVIWVNTFWSPKVNPDFHPDQVNSILRQKAIEHRNVHLVDWAGAVQMSIDQQQSLLDPATGLYPTPEGYRVRTEMIINAVQRVNG